MGNGSLGALQRFAPLFGIDAVLLSHLHADHCVDLYSYSVARAYPPAGPQPPIPVYGPAGTCERIGLVHGPGGDPGLVKRFTFETLAPGAMRIGPFDIALAHMNHPVETFGFRFTRGRPVAGLHRGHGRDRGGARPGQGRGRVPLRGGVPRRTRPPAQPAPDRPPGGRLREPGRRGRLVLTHLQPWNAADDAREEAAAAFAGDLDVAVAGQIIDLPGPRRVRRAQGAIPVR